MSFNVLLNRLIRLLLPLAVVVTTYLYLYPVWLGCVFPSTDGQKVSAYKNTFSQHIDEGYGIPHSSDSTLSPFRLLVLADPQLEGDSSLPDPEDALLRKLSSHWQRFRNNEDGVRRPALAAEIIQELITTNIPNTFKELRKRLDLFGNDYYLAHIFRTMNWWTKPTHVTVLGDLIGSQWVDDEEFSWRSWRYWHRVFAGGHKVEDEIMDSYTSDEDKFYDMDDPTWKNRIVNIVGNHDIGYAGDITHARMDRFEKAFGKANWDIRFRYPGINTTINPDVTQPTLHMVVLNSMLLDTPAMCEDLQNEAYEYLNSVISQRVRPVEDRSAFTLLLTHVPLHKKEGICVDAPFFDFWNEDEDCDGECKAGGLKEQNHLSEFASRPGMLESLFGMNGRREAPFEGKGRPGLILNGHDHEGCDTWHYIPSSDTMVIDEGADTPKTNWDASRWMQADAVSSHTGIREVTLRSMMGEFGGNAGLLSAWFDFDRNEWKYEIKTCKVGIQHIWWAVHVLDAITFGLVVFSLVQRTILGITTKRKSRVRVHRSKRTKVE